MNWDSCFCMLSHVKYFKYLNAAIYTVYATVAVQIYQEGTLMMDVASPSYAPLWTLQGRSTYSPIPPGKSYRFVPQHISSKSEGTELNCLTEVMLAWPANVHRAYKGIRWWCSCLEFQQTTGKTEDNIRAARQWAVSGPMFLHQIYKRQSRVKICNGHKPTSILGSLTSQEV